MELLFKEFLVFFVNLVLLGSVKIMLANFRECLMLAVKSNFLHPDCSKRTKYGFAIICRVDLKEC
jgi:hypothetical protein